MTERFIAAYERTLSANMYQELGKDLLHVYQVDYMKLHVIAHYLFSTIQPDKSTHYAWRIIHE